jgi:hypothetical protein
MNVMADRLQASKHADRRQHQHGGARGVGTRPLHIENTHCNGSWSTPCFPSYCLLSTLVFLPCISPSALPSFFLLVPRDWTGHVDSRPCLLAQSTCQLSHCEATGRRRAGAVRRGTGRKENDAPSLLLFPNFFASLLEHIGNSCSDICAVWHWVANVPIRGQT